MSEMTCAQIQASATEYALGILAPAERAGVAAHLLRCDQCRAEVQDISRVGDRLLDLVPDAEPPLGLDHRILATMRPRRRPRAFIAAVAAAAAAAVIAGFVVSGSSHHSPPPAELAGVLHQDGRDVGSVYISGRPTWIDMTVHGLSATGTVSCQLVERNGSAVTVGRFQLVSGNGSWGAPDSHATAPITGARLIDQSGHVVAEATLSTAS